MRLIRQNPWRAAVLAALLLYPLYVAAQASLIDGSRVLTNGYLIIRDSYLRVGTGSTPDVALGRDDVFVEGTLEVDGASRFDGALTAADDFTLSSPTNGGNAGARSQIQGLVKVKMVSLGTMTNGSTETTSYTDDSSAGEYAPIDADVTEAEGSVAGIYRVGSSSYRANFLATAAAGDGFKRTITSDDLQNNESIGFWLYCSVAIASGDLQILLTDDGGARNVAIGACPATTWTWFEVSIAALDGTTGDAVTEFGITLTSQGATALGAFTVYLDGAWKWDATDEEDLNTNLVQDGVLSVATIATAAGTANTPADLIENTGFFIAYNCDTTDECLVTVTDQSANSGIALVAYQ